jgi:hypothetical protein
MGTKYRLLMDLSEKTALNLSIRGPRAIAAKYLPTLKNPASQSPGSGVFYIQQNIVMLSNRTTAAAKLLHHCLSLATKQ